MAIMRAVCPGCGAGLKCTDPAGFAAGEALTCPKCDTDFKVKAAAPVAARPVAAKPAAKKPQVIDDDEDVVVNDSAGATIGDLIAERLNRRDLITGALASSVVAAALPEGFIEPGQLLSGRLLLRIQEHCDQVFCYQRGEVRDPVGF